MKDRLRALGTRLRSEMGTCVADAWGKHRWGTVTSLGALLAFDLDDLVTKVIMPRPPFTPHHRLRSYFLQRVYALPDQAGALIPQSELWDSIIHYAVAFVMGVLIGCVLTRKHSLAAFVAVLPLWLLRTAGALIVPTILWMERFEPGAGHSQAQDVLLAVMGTAPILVAAVLGSLLARLVLGMMRPQRSPAG